MSTTSDLNLIHRTLFLDTCTPTHTGTLSMLDASAPIGATQDFDCVDYYGLAMSNELAYMPTTPVPSTPWFAVGEQLEAPIQGQDLNIHDINMMTRDDIDEVRAVLPPQAAEPVAAQGIDGAPSDMSTSTDDGTNSDGFGSPSSKKHGREDEQSGSPRQKKSRVEKSASLQQKKSRKGGRTTRSASSRSQSSDDEQEKKKKPEFTCGAGGVVHVPMKMPKKNRSLFRKFLARDWQGFRDEAFALARINYKTLRPRSRQVAGAPHARQLCRAHEDIRPRPSRRVQQPHAQVLGDRARVLRVDRRRGEAAAVLRRLGASDLLGLPEQDLQSPQQPEQLRRRRRLRHQAPALPQVWHSPAGVRHDHGRFGQDRCCE
jgi:hypothetical protein